MARKSASSPDFESTLTQLETIVARLESGELPLEESLKEFEQGIQLAQLGQARLQQAEQRIQILLQKSETAPLSDYEEKE
ncbi:exodeoxyribonuclease VII small subunit [Rodentibacter trehalosifermentans]|uniref:Exodeoxyribonuclease 7 small subunit n=1 Tax=Rodentibacter trehalosifermentans TaxID=1908263 RepID=A0A1V3IWR5_9PAST|nr:exodeoxyribonuclease VII small subunit [Rodentibacter trehalosifermentans]OOF43279.1 exodeoxyribonuclease VII small subunit [Rodentibacter trehalosifermentans]OOF46659.1 exodeoxyribonuclease VII small subunit [Rodentibacter trehalosifermentans]OOF52385.1 exodeoxyribonuclease VII small subunit [Rodentibacter trehalosifermentans]